MTADVSVVVPTHAEGRILVSTLRSVAEAASHAASAGLQVELVLVMDRIDAETRRVIEVHATPASVAPAELRLLEVDNGDLGMSRNDGVAAATAPVIAILDGDNLVSATWLARGVQTIRERGERAIAHPESIVSFGARRTRWDLQGSGDADYRPGLIAAVNPWDACVIAHRSTFAEVPYLYLPPSRGHGPEDWAWNLATLDAGYEHVVVPETVMFYRVRPGSLLDAHGDNLLPPSPYLASLERAASVVATEPAADDAVARTPRDVFREVVPRPIRLAARTVVRGGLRAARIGESVVRGRGLPSAPAEHDDDLLSPWLDDAWRAANRIEPEVPFPRADAVASYETWGHPWGPWESERAVAYWRLVDAFGGAPDYLFVAPWVRTGGGDRVLLQYIAAVRRLRPDARIVLLTTEPDESTRLSEVPAGVRVVQLRDYLSRAVDREWMVGRLLPQLLTQLPPQTVHLFNSTVGYDVVERFGRILSLRTAFFVSTFVLDRTPDGERTSVLFYRHPRFLDPIQAVLVDSEAFAATMVREQGYAVEKFRVQRQIVADVAVPTRNRPDRFTAADPLRVLWAGRFDLQKRLDVLADVAEEVQRRGLPVQIDFYGEAVMGDPGLEDHLSRLRAAGAVRHPAYHDIAEVPLEQYDLFLMTSEWEGVPNTLLEAMMAELPVLAPLVGGVGEVLSEQTGYPVARFDDAGGYADALARVIDGAPAARSRARAARQLVSETFSQAAFDAGIGALPSYLDGLSESAETGVTAADPSICFVADDETVEFLQSDARRVLLFAGSAGYANLGDILQHKNVLHQWKQDAPDVVPVSVFHVGSAESPDHLEQLRSWYATRHIVFFHRPDEEVPEWLRPTMAAEERRAPVHVVGGGYLNAEWGPGYLAVLDAMDTHFGAETYVFSGMQIDEFIVPLIVDFAARHHLSAFGTRDDESFERARAALGAVAARTFDDLWEIVSRWVLQPQQGEHGPFHLGLHINASGYVGTDVVEQIAGMLRDVLEAHPDARVTLLNAYDDRRAEVMDTLAALRLFGDSFPFTQFDVVDLARISLETGPRDDTPTEIAQLHLDAAITCSYHTTMIMHSLGIPAFLLRRTAYYAQKARIFELPDDFATFLAEPARFLKDFSAEERERRQWTSRLAAWIRGESVVLGERS
ncbi:glycosyltransferase [Microbacterium sp. NPDC006705]|uniref:glycosyltransferase n=1 Tax=Microbacterium sp. NPDC006705 TaxID=3364181 RepID=UPI00384D03F3